MLSKTPETAAQWAARAYEAAQESEHDSPLELRKVSLRLPSETVAILDALSGKLRQSRSATAENLLVRAIEEAACEIGLSDEEDGVELSLLPSQMEALVEESVTKYKLAELGKVEKSRATGTDRQ